MAVCKGSDVCLGRRPANPVSNIDCIKVAGFEEPVNCVEVDVIRIELIRLRPKLSFRLVSKAIANADRVFAQNKIAAHTLYTFTPAIYHDALAGDG